MKNLLRHAYGVLSLTTLALVVIDQRTLGALTRGQAFTVALFALVSLALAIVEAPHVRAWRSGTWRYLRLGRLHVQWVWSPGTRAKAKRRAAVTITEATAAGHVARLDAMRQQARRAHAERVWCQR